MRPAKGNRERFIGRHVSALRALIAHGVEPTAAVNLIQAAKKAGRDELSVTVPSSSDSPAQALLIRRMRGGHADVYRVSSEQAE